MLNNKITKNREMKKLIYSVAVVLVAAMALSCSGKKSSYMEGITKGSKSQMDSLSYAIGANVGYGVVADMPDLKLDWEVMAKAAEKQMLKDPTIISDEEHEAALEKLQTFFNESRRPRMDDEAARLIAEDSTRQLTREDFVDFDVFETDKERREISKAYGCDMGTRLRTMRMPLQSYWVKQGLIEGAHNKAAMTIEQTQSHIQKFYTETLPMKNSAESEAWLADIEKQSGVQKTASGLLYRIDRMGDENAKPTATDIVNVDYEGKLRDGVVFDSSYERGEAIEFPLQNVIKGWTEGMQLVGKGGQITLWIPAELAYGAYGSGSGIIGPNEALEFKVELHDIKTPEAEPATQSAE